MKIALTKDMKWRKGDKIVIFSRHNLQRVMADGMEIGRRMQIDTHSCRDSLAWALL